MTRWRGLYRLAAIVGLSGVLSAPAQAGSMPPPAQTTVSAREHASAVTQQHGAAPLQRRTANQEETGDESNSATVVGDDQVAAPAVPGSGAQRYALLLAGLGVMVWLRRRSTASQ